MLYFPYLTGEKVFKYFGKYLLKTRRLVATGGSFAQNYIQEKAIFALEYSFFSACCNGRLLFESKLF